MSQTLYEIKDDMLTLMEMLEKLAEMEEEESEIMSASELTEQRRLVKDTLDGVKGELEAKAEGYIAIRNELRAKAQIFAQEKEKWAKKEAIARNSMSRLEGALMNAMVELGMDGKDGLDTGMYKLKVVGNGGNPPIEVDDNIDHIPDEYIRIKREPNKKAILDYLKSLPEGITVPWARLLPRGKHLIIAPDYQIRVK